MKCRNTITGNVFDVSFEEGQKLFEEFDCFEVAQATCKEKSQLKKVEKKNLTIKEKVMKSKRKEN